MLAEHHGIVAALERLSAAAKAAGKTEYVEFAAALTLHAQTGEEVAYPAAIVIGEYIQMSLGATSSLRRFVYLNPFVHGQYGDETTHLSRA